MGIIRRWQEGLVLVRLGLGGLLVKRVKPLVIANGFIYLKFFNSPITFPIISKLLIDIEIQSSPV